MARKGSWLLYNRIPLIGDWLRQRKVTSLSEDKSARATAVLAEAFSLSDDQEVRTIAYESLVARSDQPSVDAICSCWASLRSPELARLIVERGWVATRPIGVRVMTALNNGRTDIASMIPADGVQTLLNACGDKDEVISQHARKTVFSLQNQEAIDYLCQKWIESRSGFLDHVVEHAKYIAKQPLDIHVLSSLRTGMYTELLEAGRDVVPILIAACSDPSEEVAKAAANTLRRLKNPDARDAVCALAISVDDEMAKRVAIEANYAPTDEQDRALFFFLTEQWERYENLDFDRQFLQTVYETASSALKVKITDRLRRSGRTDFLQIISGGDYRSRVGAMTPTESDLVVQMLKRNAEWQKLWALAFELPFFSSTKVVKILVEAGWKPSKPDDVELLNKLITIVTAELPETVDEILPHMPLAALRAKARVTGRVADVAFSPTRPWIAIAGRRQVVVWDFQAGEPQESFRGFKRTIGNIVFTEDNALACSEGMQEGRESILHCWLKGNRFQVKHNDMITSLCPVGGSRMLITRYDQHAVLWDAETNNTLKERGLSFWPRASRASANGEQVLLLHEGVALVDLPDITLRAESKGRIGRGVSRCAAFAPDEDCQIVGNFNGDVFVTNRNGENIAARPRKFTACDGQAQGIEVLGDEGIVVTAGAGGRVDFISWENETLIGSVTNTGQRLTSLRVSPGGDFMALGDSDSTMSFWDLRLMQVPMMFSVPFSRARPLHLAAVQALTETHKLPEKVRRAVDFMACILRHRFRYDIEVAEIQSIRVGEFDIEIG